MKRIIALTLAVLTTFTIVFNSCTSTKNVVSDDVSNTEIQNTIEGYNVVLYNQKDSTSVGYSTIKEALSHVSSEEGYYVIYLQSGEYKENYIYYNGKATVKICGVTDEKYGKDVIITGRGENMGKEKGRELIEFDGKSNLILENVTLKSDLSRKSVKGDAQAEVIGFDSTGYVAAYNCAFISHQDTMRTTGKGWFYKCYVEGDTDFIWMESAGCVALYEECEIVSCYDEYASTHASYILAPRASVANTVGKGAVIYNSKVILNNDSNFLFRNPWGTNKDYYNQGAFVNCTFEGNGSVDAAVAKSDAMGIADQQYVGWKLDENAASLFADKKSSIGTISDEILSKEYNGRRAILNRNYSVKYEKFVFDAENQWDIDSFIKTQRWSVSEDSSKAILKGESKISVVTYDLTQPEVPGITENGFKQETGKAHHVGKVGETITIPVKGPCTVAVTGYYAGNGTIKAGTQGEGLFACNNGSTSKFVTSEYVVYQKNAKQVVITATKTSYLTKITVTYDSKISFKPVESVTVSAADNVTEITGKKSLQFAAKVTPFNATNTDYVWSVSDESAAKIDASGLLTAEDIQEEKTITVVAKALDEAGCEGSYELTIIPASANAVDLTWLEGTDSSFKGSSTNEAIATAKDCVPSKKGDGITWAYNSSKNGGTCNSGVTLSAEDADPQKGEWYIEYPITNADSSKDLMVETLKIAFGNAGTDNFRAYVTFVDNNGKESVVFDDDNSDKTATCNPRKITYEFNIAKVIPAGKTAKVRVSIHGYQNGNFKQALTGKSPTWGKTIITCTAGKFAAPGKTYEINLCSEDNLKAAGTDNKTGLFEWTGANPGSAHGLQAGKGTISVAGNSKITFGLCRYGKGTITVKNGKTEIATINVEKLPSCYGKGVASPDFTSDCSQSIEYSGNATTLNIEWSNQVYLEGIKIEPLN